MPLHVARLELETIERVTAVLDGRSDGEEQDCEMAATFRAKLKPDSPRQLAGLLNASRGRPAFMIFGVNQRARELVPPGDPNDWVQQVEAGFVEGPPEVIDEGLVTIDDTHQVHVFVFDTREAPYLVRNASDSPQRLEVPFRQGGSTRSARRRQMLEMLVPRVDMPTVGLTLLTGEYHVQGGPNFVQLTLSAYLERGYGETMVMPTHLASASIDAGHLLHSVNWDLRLGGAPPAHFGAALFAAMDKRPPPVDTRLHTVHEGDRQILVDGPGWISVDLSTRLDTAVEVDLDQAIILRATVPIVGQPLPLQLRAATKAARGHKWEAATQ